MDCIVYAFVRVLGNDPLSLLLAHFMAPPQCFRVSKTNYRTVSRQFSADRIVTIVSVHTYAKNTVVFVSTEV